MLTQLHFDTTNVSVFVSIFAVFYLGIFIIQYTRHELRIRSLGVRAPVLARNPLTGLRWFLGAGRAQRNHQLFEYFDAMFGAARGAATGDDCVEVQVGPACGQRYIITRDPEHVKAVLASRFASFGKGREFHDKWSPFLGDSIFTTDGARWHDSRGLIRPMFVKDRVSDLVVFERWTAALLRQIELQRGSGEKDVAGAGGDGVVDIQDLLYRMTLDVTTDFLLGASVDSLSNPRDEFAEAFNEVQRLQMYVTMLGPLHCFVPRARYRAGIRTIDRFVMPYIEAALALPAAELEKRTTSSSDFTFLHSVARHTRDPRVLRDQIVAVLLAGRDTTAATLSWALYELSRCPDKVARLRAEILDAVGPAPALPTYEHLKNMPYLRHVLNETLRLYPAVPYNLRIALEDTWIPSPPSASTGVAGPPIAVLKDDVVVYSTLAMQRRRTLYPASSAPPDDQAEGGGGGGGFPDPALFVPERWESWNPKPWTYVPFNGGPRICVGQNFAMTEMAYVVVRLLQKYERFEYVGDWNAQYHEPEIVGKPGQGVKVRFYEAAASAAPSVSTEK